MPLNAITVLLLTFTLFGPAESDSFQSSKFVSDDALVRLPGEYASNLEKIVFFEFSKTPVKKITCVTVKSYFLTFILPRKYTKSLESLIRKRNRILKSFPCQVVYRC